MMKKWLVLVTALLFSVVPVTQAAHVSFGMGINMSTEPFEPLIWMCDGRLVTDDPLQTGRVSDAGEELIERKQNYAFDGEGIKWKVLVMDKNGVEKIRDVYVTVDGAIEANCHKCLDCGQSIDSSCNARIGEEVLTVFDEQVMEYYICEFTVEPGMCTSWDYSNPTCDLCTTDSGMHGESEIAIVVDDLTGKSGVTVERETWFLNPIIAITVDGGLDFGQVRPGTMAYTSPVQIGNGAECGSGVMLDMFVTGKDFYDPSSSGAMCGGTNQLSLQNFAYHAVKGAYSSDNDARADVEGYVPIGYGNSWTTAFYNNNEVLKMPPKDSGYYLPNLLSPGSEFSLVFRLDLPEPCNGDFSEGSIYFWGEAV